MTSKIKFVYNEKPYVLEFTRNSVKEMERRGFDAAKVLEKPMLLLPDLFSGAFIAHHPLARKKLIDEIYNAFDDKVGLLNALCEMYSLVLEDFVAELEKSGNGLKWERE